MVWAGLLPSPLSRGVSRKTPFRLVQRLVLSFPPRGVFSLTEQFVVEAIPSLNVVCLSLLDFLECGFSFYGPYQRPGSALSELF